MLFRVLIISSMYQGYLDDFYRRNECSSLSYEDHYRLLMHDSTEFVASYTRNFRKKDVDAIAIISNDAILQKKWLDEHGSHRRNINKLINEQILSYKPDILWIEDVRFIRPNDLEKIRNIRSIRLMVLYHCAPINKQLLMKLKYFDHVITCTPGLENQFNKTGLTASLIYHGFDADLLQNLDESNNCGNSKIVFSGSLRQGRGYHLERIYLLDHLLQEGVDLSVYAALEGRKTRIFKKIIRVLYKVMRSAGIESPEKNSGLLEYGSAPVISYPGSITKIVREPVYGIEMYQLLANAGIVLNNHGEVAGEYAGNMRLFEATGIGSCLLTDNKKNLSDLFESFTEIVVYENKEDCAEKIKWLLEHDDLRKSISLAGQKRTLQTHTVSNRCARIIEILQQKLDCKK